MKTIVGQQLGIPAKYALEIKELHDKQLRMKSKAHHTATYLLWTRIRALLPATRQGSWTIRHSKVNVYLVKLSERAEE